MSCQCFSKVCCLTSNKNIMFFQNFLLCQLSILMDTAETKKKPVTLIQCNKLKPCEQTIRCLHKEGDQQSDVDYVFRSTVLPKLTLSLPIKLYASSTPELITVQNFLQHSFKRRYVSDQINIYKVLDDAHRTVFKKISNMPGHPSYPSLPKTKESSVLVASNSLVSIPNI